MPYIAGQAAASVKSSGYFIARQSAILQGINPDAPDAVASLQVLAHANLKSTNVAMRGTRSKNGYIATETTSNLLVNSYKPMLHQNATVKVHIYCFI